MDRNAAAGLFVLASLTALAFGAITLLDVLHLPTDAALIDGARGLLAATLLYVGAAHLAASTPRNGTGK